MNSRRNFLRNVSLSAVGSSLPYSILARALFSKKKLGVALVGLGYYSTDLLAPALQLTQFCELKGIVTGSPEKIPQWQRKYGILDSDVYNYENMHKLANNPDIDIVYIVLPNGLHKKFSIVAAEAGKHVWCEKPMAVSVSECEEMISSCKKNKVQLSIGYRMQHEPVTQKIIEWAKTKPFGNISKIYAEAGYRSSGGNASHWKCNPELGGGSMYDMGVYPLNAIRYASGLEPIAVSAISQNTRPASFNVDETMIFDLEFNNGLQAKGKCSFAEHINDLKVDCENGWYRLQPFQSYSGVQGVTSAGERLLPFKGNQQAKQMDDDALAIMNGSNPIVSGEEGLKDIRIVKAIYTSAQRNGQRILINT
ncbi:Gfo/Idh/MocA family protein [Namhaeicola litoreus]|uniref:Gfo/Idh/MocA family protein n=1 Tax=Namhaeicola litoreus TaxID=1052145 RepID=A0ABW3Y5R3_9FLAO